MRNAMVEAMTENSENMACASVYPEAPEEEK